MSTFMEMLQIKWDEGKFVCVGLDSDMNHKDFPKEVPVHHWVTDNVGFGLDEQQTKQFSFNCYIVDATRDLVCAYKPNLAFYRGDKGKRMLQLTTAYIRHTGGTIPVILDAKQADIGNTNDGYVAEDFGFFGADAVTVHPYLGSEAMKPFLDRADKGIIVLCKTSNEGSDELQDLPVVMQGGPDQPYGYTEYTVPLYQVVARNVAASWNYNGNCAVVVGATYPGELAKVREIVDDMPILIPGIGAQGGDLEATIVAGKNSRGQGMIINSSRGIIFASSGEDFAAAARSETLKLHQAITDCLQSA